MIVFPSEKRVFADIQGVQRSGSPELDPENASWVDSDDEDIDMDGVRVEDRPLHPREVTRSAHSKLEHVGYRGGFEVSAYPFS